MLSVPTSNLGLVLNLRMKVVSLGTSLFSEQSPIGQSRGTASEVSSLSRGLITNAGNYRDVLKC
jgi:hypothetical protein